MPTVEIPKGCREERVPLIERFLNCLQRTELDPPLRRESYGAEWLAKEYMARTMLEEMVTLACEEKYPYEINHWLEEDYAYNEGNLRQNLCRSLEEMRTGNIVMVPHTRLQLYDLSAQDPIATGINFDRLMIGSTPTRGFRRVFRGAIIGVIMNVMHPLFEHPEKSGDLVVYGDTIAKALNAFLDAHGELVLARREDRLSHYTHQKEFDAAINWVLFTD